MRNALSQLLALGPELAAFILTSPLLNRLGPGASSQSTIPSPNLDLSQLGRVALGGDFDTISSYTYTGQSETAQSANGSQSLLTTFPNGMLQSLATADAYIEALCPFTANGTLQGVVVGGNFTSLGGVQAQGIALYDPNTTQITPLPGLSGKVSAVYCDADSGTVYVGGSFTGGNSTNAIAWTQGWTNLPFQGFNGPVSSIAKNAAGNIVFGGQFDGVGNATIPKDPDAQTINIASGNITAAGTTTTDGYNNATNIVCKTGQEDGPGNTWLLADHTPGYWQGMYAFGFNPTKLRLYNTKIDGRGTKTFYFEDVNSGGILNMTYLDPTGRNNSCSSTCPLPQDNSTYQDFHFSPSVGMNAFRIQIVDWYGPGGGLAGIELFQNDIYSFAVNDFNEPQCDSVSQGSQSTFSGPWNVTHNGGQSSSDYLSAVLTNASQVNSYTQVVFIPDLRQSGNYSITMYTPGCLQDSSCNTRGQVNVTGTMTSNDPAYTTTLYQTNDYDKFDQIYYGYVDAETPNFRPSVTLTPVAGQSLPLTVVAQRVRFEIVTTTGGLNGLFEYNPNMATVDTDFSASAIDSAGAGLASNADIIAVATYKAQLIVAGNFSGSGISNVMSVGANATSLPGGGLDQPVSCVYQNGSTIYMGGNFTSTVDKSVTGLNGLAVYDAAGNKWSALGAGVGGTVYDIVPLSLNITGDTPESCLTVSGDFTSVNAFGGSKTVNATGFAVWVLGRNNWLQNIPAAQISVSGKLITSTSVPGFSTLYGGRITTQRLGLGGAVELVGSGQPTLQGLGVQINPPASSASTSTKRALGALGSTGQQNATGVYQGLFYGMNGFNITALGGSFSATASDGSTVQNLLFINNTQSNQTTSGVKGLDSSSIVISMDFINTFLFAGGAIKGTIDGNEANGLAVVDLATGIFVSPHPPALAGSSVVVNAVAAQPSSSAVYVGGQFSSAGSLPCPSLCYYDVNARQWNSPASGLTGTVNRMVWTSNTQLVIAGNLTVGGNTTTMATYDSNAQTYQQFPGASTLPGPIQVLAPADSQYGSWFAAGTATNNGSTYLAKYSDNAWTLIAGLGAGSAIRGLQLLSLTSDHDDSDLVASNSALLLTGNVNVPSFGNASAVIFNGTEYQPFALSSKSDGTPGTIAAIFVSNPQNLLMAGAAAAGSLSVGLVVLVGFVISLACTVLVLAVLLILERRRQRREWSTRQDFNRTRNVSRVPPEELLNTMGYKGAAPKV